MIFCFTEANEDKCSLPNQENMDYKELNRYYDNMLKEGFELFLKYFNNLWN